MVGEMVRRFTRQWLSHPFVVQSSANGEYEDYDNVYEIELGEDFCKHDTIKLKIRGKSDIVVKNVTFICTDIGLTRPIYFSSLVMDTDEHYVMRVRVEHSGRDNLVYILEVKHE